MTALRLATKLLGLSRIELRLTLISTDYKDIYFSSNLPQIYLNVIIIIHNRNHAELDGNQPFYLLQLALNWINICVLWKMSFILISTGYKDI